MGNAGVEDQSHARLGLDGDATYWGAFVCFPGGGAIPWEARNMRHSKTLWCVLNRIQRNVIIFFVNS